MRFSIVFISSAFVLASMSVALPVERENMLVARFADSDFLAEVEARAYDELYARGTSGHHKDYDTRIIHDDDDEHFMPGFPNPPSQRTASTKGPSLHPRLRTFNGRSVLDRHHRDYDPRVEHDDAPYIPGIFHHHHPSQRTASTNEPPLHRRPHAFNGNGSPGRR